MRIMKSKAKDPTYHVIQDVRRGGNEVLRLLRILARHLKYVQNTMSIMLIPGQMNI